MAEGVRAPWGEVTCNQRSNGLEDDNRVHTNPNVVRGYTAQVPRPVSGTVLGKSIGANSRWPLHYLKRSAQNPHYTHCTRTASDTPSKAVAPPERTLGYCPPPPPPGTGTCIGSHNANEAPQAAVFGPWSLTEA